ncbi:chemotaxis protein CheW [Spongisporangium articulatum]|uniref:Chemotaxis protein CheW n=1 Tax=Spongisporangium articulatum TaxID=3362603 RepID=A0ABW8AKI5_9ACTN
MNAGVGDEPAAEAFGPGGILTLAGQLRDDFDRTFSRPVVPPPSGLVDLLALQVGTERLDIRVDELCRVVTGPVITRLPSPVAAVRGVALVEDTLVTVYDLGVLLGLPATAGGHLLTFAGEPAVGVTVDAVIAHRRIGPRVAAHAPMVTTEDLIERVRSLVHR